MAGAWRICFGACGDVTPRASDFMLGCLFRPHIGGGPPCFFPTRQEGVARFYVGIRVCAAATPRPHPVSRQSSSPVKPTEYPARAARSTGELLWRDTQRDPLASLSSSGRNMGRDLAPPSQSQWIPPSIPIPLEQLSIPLERLASGPAEYPARAARQ